MASARSSAIRGVGNIQADLSQAGDLQVELDRENAEIERLRRELEASRVRGLLEAGRGTGVGVGWGWGGHLAPGGRGIAGNVGSWGMD